MQRNSLKDWIRLDFYLLDNKIKIRLAFVFHNAENENYSRFFLSPYLFHPVSSEGVQSSSRLVGNTSGCSDSGKKYSVVNLSWTID